MSDPPDDDCGREASGARLRRVTTPTLVQGVSPADHRASLLRQAQAERDELRARVAELERCRDADRRDLDAALAQAEDYRGACERSAERELRERHLRLRAEAAQAEATDRLLRVEREAAETSLAAARALFEEARALVEWLRGARGAVGAGEESGRPGIGTGPGDIL